MCQTHYQQSRRRGDLEALPPQPDRHSLTNVDRANKTADCAVCGPQVSIRVRERKGRGGIECFLKALEGRGGPGRRLVTALEYATMTKRQGGRCAICGRTPEAPLYVDHCHTTGKVRGLLCPSCNSALGLLRDNVQAVLTAAEYLKRHATAEVAD